MRLCVFVLLFFVGNGTAAQPLPRPKLVVGIAVDQMRWDYLYRYWDRYGAGGFKRLLREGFDCAQTRVNYIPTYTGPGHACIWTGSVPAIHGIAGNDWIDTRTGRGVYCTEDSSVQSVGGSVRAGKMSPRRLLSTTVGDELKLATAGRSRVFGISLKDRASILPAGHSADGVYWYDDSTGRFITSTYYRPELPAWLQAFNAHRLPDSALAAGWNLLQPASSYRHSTPDSSAYEGLFRGEKAPTFPHQPAASGLGAVRALPAGNSITLALARALVEGERLGRGTDPDLLAINLASTDYAGHQYGPNALEMEDLYIRLDGELAAFLTYLDNTVGRGQYLFFLTADHGAAHNARFLRDQKIPAGVFYESAVLKRLRSAADSLLSAEGGAALISGFENYQVYLNNARIPPGSEARTRVKGVVRNVLRAEQGIEVVYDMEEGALNAPHPLAEMMVNGHHPDRSGALLAIPAPGWYAGYAPTGTTHGTWNPYDTHIPLLWYGWGVAAGKTHRTVEMTDIAVTVCALLRIQAPSGCIGAAIPEILDAKKAAR